LYMYIRVEPKEVPICVSMKFLSIIRGEWGQCSWYFLNTFFIQKIYVTIVVSLLFQQKIVK
jgi:hypothetical protein